MRAIAAKFEATEVVLFAGFLVTLILLEAVCALLTYETVGAVVSVLYWIGIGTNLILLLLAFRSRRAAVAGILLLALVLVPYQFALAGRLWRVQTEASRIVAYAFQTRIAQDAFPADLAGYTFHDPAAKPFIQEYRQASAAGGFVLCYYVGMPSTSHCYSPKDGWTYYPD